MSSIWPSLMATMYFPPGLVVQLLLPSPTRCLHSRAARGILLKSRSDYVILHQILPLTFCLTQGTLCDSISISCRFVCISLCWNSSGLLKQPETPSLQDLYTCYPLLEVFLLSRFTSGSLHLYLQLSTQQSSFQRALPWPSFLKSQQTRPLQSFHILVYCFSLCN